MKVFLASLIVWTLIYVRLVDSCVPTSINPPKPGPDGNQNPDDLNKLLGGTTKISPLRSDVTGGLIDTASDLDCYRETSVDAKCRWRNARPDERLDNFDWQRADGQPDGTRWNFFTGSLELPQPPYLLAASGPRPTSERAVLISEAIDCQQGEGMLHFKYWTSRARVGGQAPRVNVCWKYRDVGELQECVELDSNPLPSPKSASVNINGAPDFPFELVIYASNFMNSPEGGFIAVDDLRYDAVIQKGCDDQTTPEMPFLTSTQNPDGGRSTTPFSSQTTTDGEGNAVDYHACTQLQCDIPTERAFCNLNPSGAGASGKGIMEGWKVVDGNANPTNPHTGVKKDIYGTRDGFFAVADFPDPRQDPQEPDVAFVLESPQFILTKSQYLIFQRYMATAGHRLSICKNGFGSDCLWESPQLLRGQEDAGRNREWQTEMLRLPKGEYQLFFIAKYDGSHVYNAGQVGVAYLKMFSDRKGTQAVC